MSETPGLLAAFAAGLLSFLSPCVLPLVPVYLSFISGESVAAIKSGGTRKWTLLARSGLFVAGFSAVFTALSIVVVGGGMLALGAGYAAIVSRIAGIAVVILALNMLFDFIPFLRIERRADPKLGGKIGGARAFLIGMAFAVGWTPCVGPILSSILLYAGNGGNGFRAALLLVAYSGGLGVPFILSGLFLDRAMPVMAFVKRHMRAVQIASAVLLIAFAVPLLLG